MSEQTVAVVEQTPEEIFLDVLKETVEKLQERSLLPQRSWDGANFSKVSIRGYDQGFGGEWVIKTRDVRIKWNKKYHVTEQVSYPIAAYLVFRAEIPLLRSREENQDPDAQRRWFLEQVRVVICFAGGENPFLELSAKDSIFTALELFAPQS